MALGKQRLPVIKNSAYCRILISINLGKLKPQEIADTIGIDQSVVIRHLKYLTSKEVVFVLVEKVKKTKRYSVNWDKIVQAFFDYCREVKPSVKIPKQFYGNRLVKAYFALLFKGYASKNVYVTIESLFRNTQVSVMGDLIGGFQTTAEQKVFAEFAEFLRKYIFLDDVFDDVLTDVANRLNKAWGYDEAEINAMIKRGELKLVEKKPNRDKSG